MQNSKYEAWNYETTSSKIDSAHLLQIVKGFSFLLIFTLWPDIKKSNISSVVCIRSSYFSNLALLFGKCR